MSLGGILLASLFLNLVQGFLDKPKQIIDVFRIAKEMALPWIPYISFAVILLSSAGTAGLLRYRVWGFYCLYLSYVTGTSVVYFPFSPAFIFQFSAGLIAGVLGLILLFGILVLLIYLHHSGKKQDFFAESITI
jgi:hypothetical protein